MPHVTLDAMLADKLQGLGQVVELRDPSGRVLGRFVPSPANAELESFRPQLSAEELQRRKQSSEWYTTAEVLARLEKL